MDFVTIQKYINDVAEHKMMARKKIDELEQQFEKDKTKENKGLMMNEKTELNIYTKAQDIIIANMLCEYLFSLETKKIDGNLDESYWDHIKSIYNMIADGCRLNSRYKKLPFSWLSIGAMAGVLEDFIVIMRTPSQIGIGNKHMFTIDEIVNGITQYFNTEDQTLGSRFLFLNFVFNNMKITMADFLRKCVNSQGLSKRIGLYDGDTTYYYAIQGLYGHIDYDQRVTKILVNDNDIPKYGIHFTKEMYAKAIWNKESTNNSRSKTEIPIGEIVRFDRVIHALSCVHYNEVKKCYEIDDEYCSIRNRMVHGIAEKDRPKYEAGLVFDVRKLVALKPNTVLMNEIGTLLITENIPHECLLACIYTDEDINNFWQM